MRTPFVLFGLVLPGCLIERDLYEERRAWILDSDEDGSVDAAEGGADCDDDDAAVHPGATEVPYDGVDQDCDGGDLVDVDGDGFAAEEAGGDDCDDALAAAHPDAEDDCYDGVDADCLGDDDDDCDADGVAVGEDCDDTDPAVAPGADDACYDGVDADCADDDDDDCDGDGQAAEAEGGTDCDDADATVFAGADESWNDLRVDNDCDTFVDDPVVSEVAAVGEEIAPPGGSALFGAGVGRLMDIDGDGLTEAYVTAPNEAALAGALYQVDGRMLASGSDQTLDASAAVLSGTAAGDLLGSAVTSGDLEDDGVIDVLVGAIGASGGRGVVYGWTEETIGMGAEWDPSGATFTFTGAAGSYTGADIAAEDVDGDGVADVLVSAPGGVVSLLLSPELGDYTAEEADFSWSPRAGSYLMAEIPGDVDGDGRADVGVEQGLVGAEETGGALLLGGTFVSGEFPADAAITFTGEVEFGPFVETFWGDRVLVVTQFQTSAFLDPTPGAFDPLLDADWEVYRSDVEGGFTDAVWMEELGTLGASFLLTAPYSPSGSEVGACVVWSEPDWRGSVFSADLPVSLVGSAGGDRACRSAASIDDVDADGFTDLLVGAEGAGGDTQGRVWVVNAP